MKFKDIIKRVKEDIKRSKEKTQEVSQKIQANPVTIRLKEIGQETQRGVESLRRQYLNPRQIPRQFIQPRRIMRRRIIRRNVDPFEGSCTNAGKSFEDTNESIGRLLY